MAVRVQKFQRRAVQHRAVALFIALHAGHHPRHARQFVHRPAQRHLGGGRLFFAQIIPLGRVHAGFHFHGEFLRADLRKRHIHICGRDGVDIKFCQRRIRAASLQPQRVFAGHARTGNLGIIGIHDDVGGVYLIDRAAVTRNHHADLSILAFHNVQRRTGIQS